MFSWPWSERDERHELLACEQQLLDSTATPHVTFERLDVPLGDGRVIHTIKAFRNDGAAGAAAEPPATDGALPLVLWHGFGQGAASFYRNQADLAARSGATVYSADWLGCGGSSRPEWTAQTCEEAEDFFVGSFEQWRQALDLPKFHLLGHSMGAIIATAFAERHPDRVADLVLASPAGVPPPPKTDLRTRLNEQPWSLRRELFKTAVWGWESGWTPHGVVRSSGGILGRSIISGYVNRRFSEDVPSKPEFAEYMYQLFVTGRQSGEHCLGCMLLPGAYAKRPLAERIPKLDVRSITFIYGSRDWMDIKPARKVQATMREAGCPCAVDVLELPEAGHQLFLDNPIPFNDMVLRATGHAGATAR